MTLDEMMKLSNEAKAEIAGQIEACPEAKLMLHGASMHLSTGLALARGKKSEIDAIGAIQGACRMAVACLSGAIERHPTIADKATKVRDIAFVLTGIADAPAEIEGPWFGERGRSRG